MNYNEKSIRSFTTGKLPSKLCLFCHPTQERCLYETDHFRVLIDTYPIVPGHLMISSKDHFGTAGELPEGLQKEFLQLKKEVCQIAMQMDACAIFYEHGKAGSCHSTSSEEVHCEHFHLHCLPLSVCIHNKISERFSPVLLTNYDELFSVAQRFGSYLYFENSVGLKTIYPADDAKVPPHYLRTLICEELGVPGLADWKSYEAMDRYLVSLDWIQNAYHKGEAYALS